MGSARSKSTIVLVITFQKVPKIVVTGLFFLKFACDAKKIQNRAIIAIASWFRRAQKINLIDLLKLFGKNALTLEKILDSRLQGHLK